MANGIGRLRTLGIAVQPTFGVAAVAPVYTLPYQDTPMIEPIIDKQENESALGSSYAINDVVNGNRRANVPLNIKVDEDQLPIFFTQRFAPTTVTVASDANVYTHTLAYTNETRHWYTLFLQDDNRNDYIVQDALFDTLNLQATSGFLMLTGNAAGAYPVTASVSNTVAVVKDFVGRHATFNYADYTGTKSATSIISANFNHEFTLIDDADKHSLGEDDITANLLTQDRFEAEIVGLETSRNNWNDFTSNADKKWDVTITDTSRTVSGTTQNTKPSIKFDYPIGKVLNHTEDAPMDQLIKENLTLLAIDKPGVSNAPAVITIVNSQDGTDY